MKNNEEIPQSNDDNFSSQVFRLCLPLTLFHYAFDKVHALSHAGLHIAQKDLHIHFYYTPFLQKWLSNFIQDCIDRQMKEHENVTTQSCNLTFLESVYFFTP